ncbi:type I pullulanase [Deinococcus roseus]|uniref:pullulanase n=1 Tax=Deinococcus roseus TaxID=392414 RepID=A0ABQ2DIG4_9DEIO|nr:type I pullulanase [Deinococcus roseus]GGJ57703.1 pullulanase [Deinococcus roseus]
MFKRPLLLSTLVTGLVACNLAPAPTPPTLPAYPSYLQGKDLSFFKTKLGNPNLKSVLVLHYHRFDDLYNTWNVWSWIDGLEGVVTQFTEDDKFGKIAIIGSENLPAKRGFIVRKGEWEAKDTPDDRFADIPASGLAEIWVVSGQKAFYTDPKDIDLTSQAKAAFMDSSTQVKITYNIPPEKLTKDKLTLLIDGKAQTVSAITVDGKTATITLATALKPEDASKPITLTGLGIKAPLTVHLRDVLSADAYTYAGGDLGATYAPGQTTFKVWTPVSSAVRVKLFNSAADTTPFQTVNLVRGDKGVWSGSATGNLAGKFYLLEVVQYGVTKTTADPYSKAASNYFETQPLNQMKSAVVDLASTNPDNWASYTQPSLKRHTDANVYEVHIRDFTVSASSGVDAGKRGKYLGMVQTGTKLPGTSISTGLDHLKQLGVNAVQLMPTFDYGNESEGAYNWGYDPVFYNVPEGQYSTQPGNPAATIKEFKTMVKGLHENGLNVIMDVVYNHTKVTGERSPFDQLVPYYYYRTDDEGAYLNDTGVGNVIAAERPMARKFIIDSLKYWASEYHIQGFRFDLLGTVKPADVKTITEEVRKINPSLVLYGEPWTGGGPTYFGKGAQKGMNVGVFNDNFRNGIIGGVFEVDTKGFIQGAFNLAPAVQSGLGGSLNDFAQEPGESVNYATSHDNYVLWDRLTLGASKGKSEATLKQMQKMASALVQTAQGLSFMVGGEEFARSKKGNGNSYNAGDDINQFDWTRLQQFADVSAYYSNIIKLRQAHPAFHYSSRADVLAAYHPLSLNSDQGVIGFVLDGTKAKDSWNHILVVFNANEAAQKVTLPDGNWKVMVKGDTFSSAPIEMASGEYTVPALSTVIAYADTLEPLPDDPALPQLKSALNLDTTNLSEFDAAGCSTDATPTDDWGPDNILTQLCVAQDTESIYLGLQYKVGNDNLLMAFLTLAQGGPVSNLLQLDNWKRNVQFDAGVAPKYLVLHNPGQNALEFREIQDAAGTTKTLTPAVLSSKQAADGTRFLKARFLKSTFGANHGFKVSTGILGGENWGGAEILPRTGNSSSGDPASLIQIHQPLPFSY